MGTVPLLHLLPEVPPGRWFQSEVLFGPYGRRGLTGEVEVKQFSAAEQKSRVGDPANRFAITKNKDGNTMKYNAKGLIWKMTFLFKVLIFRLSMLVVFCFFSAARREGKMGSPWWEDVLNLYFDFGNL